MVPLIRWKLLIIRNWVHQNETENLFSVNANTGNPEDISAIDWY